LDRSLDAGEADRGRGRPPGEPYRDAFWIEIRFTLQAVHHTCTPKDTASCSCTAAGLRADKHSDQSMHGCFSKCILATTQTSYCGTLTSRPGRLCVLPPLPLLFISLPPTRESKATQSCGQAAKVNLGQPSTLTCLKLLLLLSTECVPASVSRQQQCRSRLCRQGARARCAAPSSSRPPHRARLKLRSRHKAGNS
jgi:hypothetical protein